MSRPDILIGESENKVVGKVAIGTDREAVQNSLADGRAAADNGRWDIQFAPEWATINLGGGDGHHSDGDLQLYNNPDSGEARPLVHLSAGEGQNKYSRVSINGKTADVDVGSQGQTGSISVFDRRSGLVCEVESDDAHGGLVRAHGRSQSSVALRGTERAVEFTPAVDRQDPTGTTYVLEYGSQGIRLGDKDAANGPSLVLGADDSKVTVENDDGDPVFQIDTDDETIKTKWEIDEESEDL